MSAGNLFSCPSCGAPLAAPGDKTEVRCSYCGATVIVPEALRPKPPSPQFPTAPRAAPYIPHIPPPQVVIVEPRPVYQPPVVIEQPGGLGCFGTLIAVLAIFAVLGAMIFAFRPGIFLGFLSRLPRFGSVAAFGGAVSGPPHITTFSVTPGVVTGGGSVTVQWATDADVVRIDMLTNRDTATVSSLPASGSRTFTVPGGAGEVTFQLTASKGGLQQTTRAVVRVNAR